LTFYEDPIEQEEKAPLRLRILRNLILGWAMFVGLFLLVALAFVMLFPPVSAIYNSIVNSGCELGPAHNASIDIGDTTVLRVVGERGNISIAGRPGMTTVLVEGQTCAGAESARYLDLVILNTSHVGDEIIVSVDLPRVGSKLVDDIRMDLEIFVPTGFPVVEVDSGDGLVFVSDVQELQVSIGFGSLDATRIGGNVNVEKLEGSMALINVEGDVMVDTIRGYGEVDLEMIAGNVVIRNNRSGPARISGIGGDVTIGSAGYGHLDVNGVAGNLSVDENPGGKISLDKIDGSVSVPESLLYTDGPDA
jgi:hypothetical protein